MWKEKTQTKVYQIGFMKDKLSNVLMNYTCFEPHRKLAIYPAKTEGMLVLETRDTEFAAAVVKDNPEAKVKIEEKEVKYIKM